MSWGLRRSGFRIVAGADIDTAALRTFQRNMPEAGVLKTDLALDSPESVLERLSIVGGDIDVLVGGPPCQGFSKNVPRRSRYLDDPKNLLVRSFLAFIPVLRPRCVVMENVAEMYNAFDGAVSGEIRERLAGWGYSSEAKIHDASDFGVPQRRRRVVFIALRGLGQTVRLPEPTHESSGGSLMLFGRPEHVNVWQAIGDLAPVLGDRAGPNAYAHEPRTPYQILMREHDPVLTDHELRKLRPTQQARYDALDPGQGLRELPLDLRPKAGYSGAYGRLTKEMVAPTITRWVFHPGSGRFGHPTESRILTIREIARIQGFSDDFVFTGTNIQKSHQLGNAVPPLLMAALVPVLTDSSGLSPAHQEAAERVPPAQSVAG